MRTIFLVLKDQELNKFSKKFVRVNESHIVTFLLGEN